MKEKKRKSRSDSIENVSKIVRSQFQDILPPSHIRLRKEDKPFWDSIVAEYAKAEWSDHQLEIAAMLAQNMCDLENNQFLMGREGSVIDVRNAKGLIINKKVNPRKVLIDMYTKNILSLRRSLAIHARGKMGEPRDIMRRRQDAKDIESVLDEIDDDLIARPPKLIQ